MPKQLNNWVLFSLLPSPLPTHSNSKVSVILVSSHNQLHVLYVLICFIQPCDSVPSCDEECTPHWAVLMAGKGSGIYSSFYSPSKATTSQLQWQTKYSDRSMTEVDNSPPNFSRVSNSVHGFSELMARQTVSAQLVLWSGKARMTVLIV